MLGYYVSIGYNPCNTDNEENWETLKRKAKEVCKNPKAIKKEAKKLGCRDKCEDGCCTLEEYVDVYKRFFNVDGAPVHIDEENKHIVQYASTSTEFKYKIRRAYIRLLIQEMHKLGIEVNLEVV